LSDGHNLTPTEKEALENELKRRMNNLALLQTRQAKYGLDVPLALLNEISDELERITEIKNRLSGAIEAPSPAAQYFSKGNEAFILGDLGEAERYYRLVLDLDSHYPRASEQLRRVLREMPPQMPALAGGIPRKGTFQRGYSCTVIIIMIITIIVLILILWYFLSPL
jgi:hypothetical protein